MPTVDQTEALDDHLHDAVRVLSCGDQLLLYGDHCGRSVTLDRIAPPSAGLLLRLRRLGLTPDADVASWIPHRCSHTVLLPRQRVLWHPRADQRTPGGHRYDALPMDDDDLDLWRRINGARTCTQLAEAAGLTLPDAMTRLGRMTAFAVQAVRLYPTARRDRAGLARVVSRLDRPDGSRDHAPYRADGSTSLTAYHTAIEAPRHFDDVETTVAHAFARPHPALGMEPYGARLRKVIPAAEGSVVVEVGPGSGELARDYTAAGPHVSYLRIDRSPGLLNAQRAVAPHTAGLVGDATALPLADHSVDVLLCNEVIADLAATPTTEDFDVDPAEGQQLFNTGAFQLVREIARVLAPGGVSFVSEFGAPDEVPTETRHLDHPEVSIHFGQLLTVARQCGLQAELVPLADLLAADLHATWLSRGSYEALRARWPDLQARAWTAADIDTPDPVEGLVDVPISQDGPAPVVTRFWAMVARASNRCTDQV